MKKYRRFDLGTNVFVDFNNVLRHILQGNAGQKLEPSTIKGATLQNEFYNIVQVTACTAVRRVLYTLYVRIRGEYSKEKIHFS